MDHIEQRAALTEKEARTLTHRIQVQLDNLWDLVVEAYHRQAHKALGYRTWDQYCSSEFGSNRIRLPREERAETVTSLHEAGLSNRAIASATGVNEKTVRNDLKGPGAENSAPSTLSFIDPSLVEQVDAAREFAEQLNELGRLDAANVEPNMSLLTEAGQWLWSERIAPARLDRCKGVA